MSILTELRAALEAKLEARRVDGHSEFETIYLHALLTDDTIRALLDTAEAADIFCACERGGEPISRMSMEIALAPLVKEADHDRA